MILPRGNQPLDRWEKLALIAFGVFILAFGVITEIRSAFLSFKHTDFNVYTHVGWVVRNGGDIYGDAIATNGLHYVYPSPFSILMVPFADPPPWITTDEFYVPYPVSVGVWFTISVAFAMWAVHLLAGAILPDAKRGTRRWWYARTIPFYVCLGGIGFSLGRGQVNLMIVALFAASFAAAIRGRRLTSGLWLGVAIVFKLIPAFLLLFPALRRDWRAGAGVAVALIVGLGVIPIAMWGPQKARAQHEFFIKNVVLAGTTGSGDHPMGKDLTHTTATDSQSFVAAIHHIRYQHLPRSERPKQASSHTRLAHWAIGGTLTLITLLVAWRRLTPEPKDQLVFFGCLCALLMVVTPVSHMHYYAMVLPMVSALWLRSLAERPGEVCADARTTTVLVLWGLAVALPLFPGSPFDELRECGFGTAATVGLWAFGLTRLGKRAEAKVISMQAPLRQAA